MGWHSEEMITLPAWTSGEGSVALLELVHDELSSEPEFRSWPEPTKEEGPCWWILSALESCEGKEAREAYYARM
jgi:hypothetical protein